jgi:two-component system, chemotaxis family, chemotaxis protein CheY
MKKILIIDDSDIARFFLVKTFQEEGFEVIEANSGQKGIDLFKEHSPDLVTLDITMPKMNGIIVLEELIMIDPNAKIVMISAVGQRAIVLNCLKLGAKGYITKPFNEQNVIDTIKKYI